MCVNIIVIHTSLSITLKDVVKSPNAPKTPTRTIRVSDDLWLAVQKKASKEKVTVTSVIIEALEAYIALDKRLD